jgi:hypothetical protein
MRFRTISACLILGLVAMLVAPALLADGTLLGTLGGKVLDQDGKALPGATVELTSADKGFQRTAVTDAAGSFNFPLLQPGPYIVRISLSGFQSYEAKGVIVAADKTTAVPATLKLAAAAEAVTVTGEAPLVDKTNTTATTSITSALTEKIPVGRNYQTVMTAAPGVTSANNSGNPNSHGALNSNNLYLFDGVDTTDVTTGTFGQNFNFEAIQEVNVSTTGISAEYGRAQGAIVNVVTKSGTNQLHGSFKLLLTNDNWNSQTKGSNPETGDSFARVKFDKVINDYAATLGGPVWQDHIWFFGSYEWVNNTTAQRQTLTSDVFPDQTGQSYQQTTHTRLWDGKLTGQVTPSQLVTAQFNSDPIKGFIVDYWGASADLGALTEQDQNLCNGIGCLTQLAWSGVFGSRVSAEARWARQNGNIFVVPAFGSGSPYFSLTDELFYNGATFDGQVARPRTQANVSGSVYHEIFGKPAQFKAGVDYQSLRSVAAYTYPNNEIFVVNQFDPANGQNQIPTVGDEWDRLTTPVESVSRGKIWGFYGLEKFELGPVSLNLGVRIDHQTSESDIGNTVIDSTKAAPRLYAAYDVTGDGKTLISGGWGRYYQFLLQSIADSIFSGVPVQTNRDVFFWDGSNWVFDHSIRAGGNSAPINNDLNPSYNDEFNIAVQRQIGNTMSVGARGIYRKWYNIVDDIKFTNEDGALIQTPQNFSSDILKRSFKALELTFDKRFSDNWQALINYTLSRAYGNQFSDFASQRFDFPDENCRVTTIGTVPCSSVLDTNRFGVAPYDRTHVLNLFSAYTWSWPAVNLTAAPAFTWFSGLPYQRTRTVVVPSGATGVNTYFDPRGSSRLPSSYQFDFALEATFKPAGSASLGLIGGPLELGVKGEVFNVTNQQEVLRSDRIELRPSEGEPNGAAGSIFGAPTSRTALQAPRAFRFTGFIRF